MHPKLIAPNSLRVYHSRRGLVKVTGTQPLAFGELCRWLVSVAISLDDGGTIVKLDNSIHTTAGDKQMRAAGQQPWVQSL